MTAFGAGAGAAADSADRPRSAPALALLAIVALALFCSLVALGNWQIERRRWKHDLVERIAQRVHAAAVTAPGPRGWLQVTAARDEYRRVLVTGTFLHERETLVQASTRLGAGFWVLTPLRIADGTVVLVNRGFVLPEGRDRARRAAFEPSGEVSVTGLLRITEPGGGFLRRNDAAVERWYSRDVQAMAASRRLGAAVAPYFIDAEAAPGGNPDGEAGPVGGLTVIDFSDNHLAYALTWYALAAMVVLAAGWVVHFERRLRR